jgi:hypothetical protein
VYTDASTSAYGSTLKKLNVVVSLASVFDVSWADVLPISAPATP